VSDSSGSPRQLLCSRAVSLTVAQSLYNFIVSTLHTYRFASLSIEHLHLITPQCMQRWVYDKWHHLQPRNLFLRLRFRVRPCSVVCGVAQQGAALLSLMRRCSVSLRRCSVRVRRCSVGRASGCCKSGPNAILVSAPKAIFPLSLLAMRRWTRTSAKFAANGDGIMCCTYECTGMIRQSSRK
jgi:hypothetical protein